MALVGNEILFTKVAGKGQFGHSANTQDGTEMPSVTSQTRSKPDAVRLQLSRESVASIESNVARYKEFLQKRSHHTESQFNPWTAVEQ